MLQGLFNKLDKNNNNQPQPKNLKHYNQELTQTKSIVTTSDADSEFQIIRAKSEFVEHDRYMPFEPQAKKVESSILNKKDVLRFTK